MALQSYDFRQVSEMMRLSIHLIGMRNSLILTGLQLLTTTCMAQLSTGSMLAGADEQFIFWHTGSHKEYSISLGISAGMAVNKNTIISAGVFEEFNTLFPASGTPETLYGASIQAQRLLPLHAQAGLQGAVTARYAEGLNEGGTYTNDHSKIISATALIPVGAYYQPRPYLLITGSVNLATINYTSHTPDDTQKSVVPAGSGHQLNAHILLPELFTLSQFNFSIHWIFIKE
jgi:hypothetical protein